ncbi:MAG: tetratricopeptide repeat protein [Promethearchaeota archaeon]
MRRISTQLEELLKYAKFQEILHQVEKLEKEGQLANLSSVEWAKCSYYKSRALERLSHFEEALQVAIQARMEQPSPDNLSSLILLIAQLYVLWRLNSRVEIQIAIAEGDSILESLPISEHNAATEWRALYYNVKGNIYLAQGELDSAIENYERSLNLREAIGKVMDIIESINNIAVVYFRKGMFDTTLEYGKRYLKLSEAVENSRYIASSLLFMGNIHSEKAEFDTALDYYKRSLDLYETLDSPGGIAHSLNNISIIHRYKGELNKAVEYNQRSLALREKLKYDPETAESLFNLIICLLDKQEQDQAQHYFNQLLILHKQNPHRDIEVFVKLAEGLILTQSKRMKDKVKAQALLSEIADTEWRSFSALAMFHLCDLLLIELKSFGDREVLVEAKILIEKIHIYARNQHLFPHVVSALLLRAKLATVEGNLQQAQQYLNQARMTAEEKNMHLLVEKVDSVQKNFETEFEKWRDLIQRNTSIQERIEYARVEEYLKEAQKLVGR